MSDKNRSLASCKDGVLTRRGGLRASAAGLCTEISEDTEQLGLLLDVSEHGLRLERPLAPSRARARERVIQLEFEHPAVDELIWAKGVIRFDRLEPLRETAGTRVKRTSGVEIISAASRHLRLLREFVLDLRYGLTSRLPFVPTADVRDDMAPFWSTAFRLG
jgi:hypothetical protein